MPQNEQNYNNKNTIRVLVLTTSYPLGPGDSSSVFLKYLCEHLQSEGVEIHVLAPAQFNGGDARENGITVHRFRYMFRPWQKLAYGSGILPNLRKHPMLWWVVPIFLFAFFFASLRTIYRVKPDVLHGHWIVPTGMIGIILSQLSGVPFLISAHGSDAFLLQSGIMKGIKKFILDRSKAWTANTLATANAVAPTGSNANRYIIPMGVDTEKFSPSAGTVATKGARKNILFVGRLVEKKGVSVLLDAIALLPQDVQESIFLTIVGDGTDRRKLESKAKNLKIDQICRFSGFVPNPALPDYLRNADLLVAPSIIEGQGIVLLEAMACGLPVVASNVGGIAEVIENGVNGILVPPGDAEKLSLAVNELLFDDKKISRIAKNGLQVIRTRYTWDLVSKQFLEIYESVAE